MSKSDDKKSLKKIVSDNLGERINKNKSENKYFGADATKGQNPKTQVEKRVKDIEDSMAKSDRQKAISNRVADARQYDDSSTQGMDSIKGKLKIQKAKAGASNPPHNFKKR